MLASCAQCHARPPAVLLMHASDSVSRLVTTLRMWRRAPWQRHSMPPRRCCGGGSSAPATTSATAASQLRCWRWRLPATPASRYLAGHTVMWLGRQERIRLLASSFVLSHVRKDSFRCVRRRRHSPVRRSTCLRLPTPSQPSSPRSWGCCWRWRRSTRQKCWQRMQMQGCRRRLLAQLQQMLASA